MKLVEYLREIDERGRLSMRSDYCLWQLNGECVKFISGVRGTCGLSRVLLWVGGSSFRGEVILPF